MGISPRRGIGERSVPGEEMRGEFVPGGGEEIWANRRDLC